MARWPAGRAAEAAVGALGSNAQRAWARQGHRLCSPSQDRATEGRAGVNCLLSTTCSNMAHAMTAAGAPPPPPLALALGK